MQILGITLSNLISVFAAVVILGLLAFIFFRTLTKWIVKVPPDHACIVYGVGTKSTVNVIRKVLDKEGENEEDAYKLITEEVDVKYKIVTGGATLVIPALQEYKHLDLGIITLEVEVEGVLSSKAVPITVDGIAQIKIGGDITHIATAAEQLLNQGKEGIKHVARETLMGHFRAIIGLLTVEETYKNRELFSQRVQEVAVEDMAGMGIEIKSFVIKDIDDDEGYIKALGAREIQSKLMTERVVTAEAVREAREKEAQQDLIAQTAELERDRKVHEKTEETSLREVAKDLAVDLATQDKNRMVEEKKALAIEQAKVAEVIVPAEASAKAKKITAEGDRQKIEVTAEANAKAAQIEARGKSEAVRLEADADAEATRKTGQAEADANKAKLTAEADGTRAKLLAEAEGTLKLAEAVAAEGQVNLIREIALAMVDGDIQKAEALAVALGNIGENVKIVQFAGGEGGSQTNALMKILADLPEMATVLNEKTKALTGDGIEGFLERVVTLVQTAGKMQGDVDVIEPKKDQDSKK